MIIALGLSVLLATSGASASANDHSAAEGAALGAGVGAAVSGMVMFGALLAAGTTPGAVDAVLDARHTAGPLGSAAAVALVSIGSSAIGAGAGYALSDGDVLDTPAVAGGAIVGATLGSAVGVVPAVIMFAASDATLARPVNGFGDAIGSGIAAGLAESFGMLSLLGSSVLLAPPAAAAGAYLAGDAIGGIEE
jgi:hypothetical protein